MKKSTSEFLRHKGIIDPDCSKLIIQGQFGSIEINELLEEFAEMSEPEKPEPFYMVFLEGCGTPTRKHPNIGEASAEAARLSKVHGKKAYVLCTIKSLETMEVKTEDLRPDHDLPF